MSEKLNLIGSLIRMYQTVEDTPHQVVLTHGDIETILAEGSTLEYKKPWGTKKG